MSYRSQPKVPGLVLILTAVGKVRVQQKTARQQSPEDISEQGLSLSDEGSVFDLPGLKLAPVQGLSQRELGDHVS